MTDTIMQDERLKHLQNENAQLQSTIKSWSGHIRAQKQALDEYFNANVALKASNILLEDDVRKFTKDLEMANQRCLFLEKEVDDLKSKLGDDEEVDVA